MQGKFPRSALIITSFLALSLTTSGVYAGKLDVAPETVVRTGKSKDSNPIIQRKKKTEASAPAKKTPALAPKSVRRPKPSSKASKITPKKAVSAKSLPNKAPTPIPAPDRNAEAVDQVQETLKQLKILDEQDVKKALPAADTASTKTPPVEKEAVSVNAVAGQLAPLGFADGSWEDAVEGFRFHATSARRLMAEGRPDLAVAEIALASGKAETAQEVTEATLLQAATDVLIGKEVKSPIVRGANQSSDWKALEVARASIAGEKSVYRVFDAINEVAKWPDPVAALTIRCFAPLVDKKSVDHLNALADRLNASGTLNPSVIPLVKGYAAKIAGDDKRALANFEVASASVLGGVASQAKLELLEAGIAMKTFSNEEIAAAATDIINIRTNDHVERRALRILADSTSGEEKINALRALEIAEYNETRKAAIKAELDKVVNQIAADAAKAIAQQKDAENAKTEAEKAGKDKVVNENKEEPTWLLEEENTANRTSKSGSISIKSINKTLNETNDIIRSFEEGISQ